MLVNYCVAQDFRGFESAFASLDEFCKCAFNKSTHKYRKSFLLKFTTNQLLVYNLSTTSHSCVLGCVPIMEMAFLFVRLCSTDGNAYSEKIQGLEQKLYKAQEELMELHRKKGEVGHICIE